MFAGLVDSFTYIPSEHGADLLQRCPSEQSLELKLKNNMSYIGSSWVCGLMLLSELLESLLLQVLLVFGISLNQPRIDQLLLVSIELLDITSDL